MLITGIIRQRGGMLSIRSQGEEVALLDPETFDRAADLALGCEISEERLEELAHESRYRVVRAKALGIVTRKEVCRRGLKRTLADGGADEDICEAVADELTALGLIDDRRFADMMADELFRLKNYAERRVAYELTQKGVSRELAAEAAAANAPDPAEAIDLLLGGRLQRDTGTEAGLRRCINTLSRYGYDMSDIRAGLERLRDGLE